MERYNNERIANIQGLDIVKFFSAILVLMSHLGPFNSYGEKVNYYLVNLSFRFAVPFFFLCAGFFFFRVKHVKWINVGKYTKRICMLYAAWTLIYILLQLPYTISGDTVKKFFLCGGLYFHLWYFPSLALSVTFVFLLLKRGALFAGCIVAALYLLGMCGDAYGGISQMVPALQPALNTYIQIFGQTRNGILFGPLFIWLGALLSKWDGWRHISVKKLGIALCLAALLLVLEMSTITQLGWAWDLNLLFSTVPLALIIFCLAAQNTQEGNAVLGNWFRKMSVLIYCSHMLVKELLGCVLNIMAVSVHSMVFFILVLSATLAFCAAIEKLSRKYQCLKVLY